MADLNKLIKFLQLWQEVEEKSTSASLAVESGSQANISQCVIEDLPAAIQQEKHLTHLANSRANMYARFIRMSEPYIHYPGGNSEYELTRTCVYGQLREDKKHGLL